MADPSSSVPNADSDLEAGVPTTTPTAPAAAPAPTPAAAADRVIPADEEEEEEGAEEQKGKEKGTKDISLRSSEYDGRAISLPPAADGEREGEGVGPEGPQHQHVGGVQLPHPGLYEEDEDEDPLVVKTREACLAVLRKVGGIGNVFVAIIYNTHVSQPQPPFPGILHRRPALPRRLHLRLPLRLGLRQHAAVPRRARRVAALHRLQ